MILRRSAALLAAATLLTACGTDSTSDTATTTATTTTATTTTGTATTTATATTVENAEDTESTESTESTEAMDDTAVETTTVIPADCSPGAFQAGDMSDPVVDFCDGAFAKVSLADSAFSIVFESVDGEWDIYPQHGLRPDGEWCYSPSVLEEDGVPQEIRKALLLCSE